MPFDIYAQIITVEGILESVAKPEDVEDALEEAFLATDHAWVAAVRAPEAGQIEILAIMSGEVSGVFWYDEEGHDQAKRAKRNG